MVREPLMGTIWELLWEQIGNKQDNSRQIGIIKVLKTVRFGQKRTV